MSPSRFNREGPPKPCPSCQRVLPRSAYPNMGGKCKACYSAHRRAKKYAPASDVGERGRPDAAVSEGAGVDYMARAQEMLFPGRAYVTLTREECGAVRVRALALFAADGHTLPREYAPRQAQAGAA